MGKCYGQHSHTGSHFLQTYRMEFDFLRSKNSEQFLGKVLTKWKKNREQLEILYENQMSDQWKKRQQWFRPLRKVSNQFMTIKNALVLSTTYALHMILKWKTLFMGKFNWKWSQIHNATCNTVYEIKCSRGDCELLNPSYVGQTRKTIKTRLAQYLQDGAMGDYLANVHKLRRSYWRN